MGERGSCWLVWRHEYRGRGEKDRVVERKGQKRQWDKRSEIREGREVAGDRAREREGDVYTKTDFWRRLWQKKWLEKIRDCLREIWIIMMSVVEIMGVFRYSENRIFEVQIRWTNNYITKTVEKSFVNLSEYFVSKSVSKLVSKSGQKMWWLVSYTVVFVDLCLQREREERGGENEPHYGPHIGHYRPLWTNTMKFKVCIYYGFLYVANIQCTVKQMDHTI